MAIRLGRTLRDENNTPSSALDISGIPEKNYDLDSIESNKSRINNSKINIHTTSKTPTNCGNLNIPTEEGRIVSNNADAVKYLFGNSPSTAAYTPSVTLRRPVVLWEDGSQDTRDENDNENVIDLLIKLENKFKVFEAKITNEISVNKNGTLQTEGSLIPNVNAVYNLFKDYIKKKTLSDNIVLLPDDETYTQIILNGDVHCDSINRIYQVDITDDYYSILETTENNNYQLKLGI